MAPLSDDGAFVAQEPGPDYEPKRPAWLTFLAEESAEAGAFRPHHTFGAASQSAPAEPTEPVPPEPTEPEDEAQARLAEEFERGLAQGRAEAAELALKEQGERRKLGIALRRLESDLRDQFAAMLAETVQSLCEASFAPVALDSERLKARCARAATMLEEAQGKITLRLNPEDIALLDADFRKSWTIAPDPALARGELRTEGREGAVLDGPQEWARALREALETC